MMPEDFTAAQEIGVEDKVVLGGTTMSLAEIAGLDTTDIEEVRKVKFPKGWFIWEISEESKIDQVTANNEERFVIQVPLNCLAVINTKLLPDEAVKLVGKRHFDNYWIKNDDPQETIGQFKAFAADVGYTGAAELGVIVDGVKKMRFVAPITHARNQNDEDNPYINLGRDKVRPVTAEETAQYLG